MVDMDTAVAPAPAAAPTAAPRKSSRMMVDLSAAIRATAETAHAQALEQVHADSAQVVDAIRARRRMASPRSSSTLRTTSPRSASGRRPRSPASRTRPTRRSLPASRASRTSSPGTRPQSTAGSTRSTPRSPASRRPCPPTASASSARTIPPTSRRWPRSCPSSRRSPRGPISARSTSPSCRRPKPAVEASQADVEAPQRSEVGADRGHRRGRCLDAEAVAERIWVMGSPRLRGPRTDAPSEDAAGGRGRRRGRGMPPPSAGDYKSRARGATPRSLPARGRPDATTDDAGDDVPRWAAGEVPEGFPTGEGERGRRSRRPRRDHGRARGRRRGGRRCRGRCRLRRDRPRPRPTWPRPPPSCSWAARPTSWDYDPEAARGHGRARRCGRGTRPRRSASGSRAWCRATARGEAGDEPRTTQVVVSEASCRSPASRASSAISAASPASQAVAVASGPEGEFVFNVTHRADLSFRDVPPDDAGLRRPRHRLRRRHRPTSRLAIPRLRRSRDELG